MNPLRTNLTNFPRRRETSTARFASSIMTPLPMSFEKSCWRREQARSLRASKILLAEGASPLRTNLTNFIALLGGGRRAVPAELGDAIINFG